MKKGKISPEFLQKIKDAVNIIEVVGEHVVLRKSGANYTGLCPFHQERSPSFSVSEQKQLYHCYGCKKGGDLVSFVMEIHGISFPEAIEELAERGKVPLPKDFSGSTGNDPEEDARSAPPLAKKQILPSNSIVLLPRSIITRLLNNSMRAIISEPAEYRTIKFVHFISVPLPALGTISPSI